MTNDHKDALRIELEMTEGDYQKLMAAYAEGKLHSLGVINVTSVEPEAACLSPPSERRGHVPHRWSLHNPYAALAYIVLGVIFCGFYAHNTSPVTSIDHNTIMILRSVTLSENLLKTLKQHQPSRGAITFIIDLGGGQDRRDLFFQSSTVFDIPLSSETSTELKLYMSSPTFDLRPLKRSPGGPTLAIQINDFGSKVSTRANIFEGIATMNEIQEPALVVKVTDGLYSITCKFDILRVGSDERFSDIEKRLKIDL